MSLRSGAGVRLGQVVLAGAVAASLSGVYLGLPWPRLVLQAAALTAGLLLLLPRLASPPAAGMALVPGPLRAAAWILLAALLTASVSSTEIAVSLDTTAQTVAYMVIAAVSAALLTAGSRSLASPSRIVPLLMAAGAATVGIAIFFAWAGAADLHGAFGNKNHFAGYLLLLLPLAVAGFLEAGPRRAMMGFGAALVLMASGLLLSQSRGAWLALAPGVAVALFLLPWRRGSWGRLAGAGLLTVLLSLVLNQTALQATAGAGAAAVRDVAAATSGQSPEGTLGPRLDYWQGAVAIARDHPLLGTGPGTFASAFPPYQNNPDFYSKYAHQVLLQTLAEAGAFGLLALLGLLVTFSWSMARGLPARQAAPGSTELVLVAGLAGGLAASLAHNLVELDWYVPAIAVLAAAQGGLLLALTNKGNRQIGGPGAPAAPWVTIERWAALLVCLAGLAWTGVRGAEGWHLAAANAARQRGDFAAAVASYRSAAAADPLSAEPQKALATLAFTAHSVFWPAPGVDPGEGLVAARRAVALASQDVDAWVLLARGFYARGAPGDDGRALEALAAAAALRHPSQAPALHQELIQGYLAAGRLDEAGVVARRLLSDFGSVTSGSVEAFYPAQAHVLLGNVAASRGDRPGAIAEYESAAGLDASNTAARFNLGVVLLEAGRPEAARNALAAAAVLDPRQAVIHYYLGLAHNALGETASARSELGSALALDPACEACRELLDRLGAGNVP